MMRISLALAALSLLFVHATTAHAASYGNFAGSTVTFETVQDQNGLFGNGAPNGGIVVSGDALDFSPNAFEAACTGGDPACPANAVTVEDTLTFFIQANPGSFIDEVVFQENGDTTLDNAFGGRARTTVAATIFIDIFELDGGSANGGQDVSLNTDPTLMVFDQDVFDTDNGDNGTLTWQGALSVLLQPTLDAAGFTNGEKATRVQVNLDNILSARVQDPNGDNPSARIEKKDADGIVITVIPEPGTGLLTGLGLLALTSLRPRRSPEAR